MAKANSLDLRERVIKYLKKGMMKNPQQTFSLVIAKQIFEVIEKGAAPSRNQSLLAQAY